MPLHEDCYLVITLSDEYGNREGVFELPGADETSRELSRESLLGPRGSLITELSDVAPGVPQIGESGSSYAIDAGGGSLIISLQADILGSDIQRWGDGSRSWPFDAGAETHPRSLTDMLVWWGRNSRTDSSSPAELHIGEWTDGRFGEDGKFDEPIPCQLLVVSPQWEGENPSEAPVTLELRRTSTFPTFSDDDVENVVDDLYGGEPENE